MDNVLGVIRESNTCPLEGKEKMLAEMGGAAVVESSLVCIKPKQDKQTQEVRGKNKDRKHCSFFGTDSLSLIAGNKRQHTATL